MTGPFVGNDQRATGAQVDISYSLKRCIHAGFCVTYPGIGIGARLARLALEHAAVARDKVKA